MASSRTYRRTGRVLTLSSQTRILIQQKGISATHPILVLRTEDETVVCSVASREGNSSFDYSLIVDAKAVPINGTDEEVVESLCQTENHIESEWGWKLALSHGITMDAINSVQKHINIANPKYIRLSRATRVNSEVSR